MSKRKVVLHGRIVGAAPVTTQKFIITIRGEVPAATAFEAKEAIFKAVKAVAKDIPGAQEFWVSQPRASRASAVAVGSRPQRAIRTDGAVHRPTQSKVADV